MTLSVPLGEELGANMFTSGNQGSNFAMSLSRVHSNPAKQEVDIYSSGSLVFANRVERAEASMFRRRG